MLCFRCEHRAAFLEGGGRPRSECGDVKTSKIGCYMYKPCKPVIMEKIKGDPRPAHGGPMMGARMRATGLAEDCKLNISGSGWLYWEPHICEQNS